MSEEIKWLLTELSNADGDDIESNELEICGEDENGVDGCFTEQITKIAEKSLDRIKELENVLLNVGGYLKRAGHKTKAESCRAIAGKGNE